MDFPPLFRPPYPRSVIAFALPLVAQASPSQAPATDSKPTVFVAGATGRVGRRLVDKLAEAGCSVRAGSRDPSTCKQNVGKPANDNENVDFIQFDVNDYNNISSRIGDASVVISALGAPFSWGRVDGFGIANLMKVAASSSSVKQLIVVSSIGVGRPWAFPAAILNLFGAVLIFKDYSEKATRSAARKNGKSFFIVRPGGMEAPTDDYYLTHNLVLESRNRLAGGNVSNMQIAELITAAVLSPDVADGKTVEAVAETKAPKVDLRTLLEGMKPDN